MILRLLTITALAIFGIATPAQAAKGKKGKKKGVQSEQVLARFDRDHNGKIDGKEATRVEGVYAALAALDADHDGKLSESELAGAKVGTAPAKGGKKKKKSAQ